MGMFRSFKKFLRQHLPVEGLINTFWHLPQEIFLTMLYGFPGTRIPVIGVAGTKGKTTTAYFISQLLEASGEKTALYSTAAIKIGNKERLNELKMTTPGGVFLRKFLRDAKREGCTYVVLEVSSHALKQHRLWGVPFTAVVITNMMPDHLDYHKTAYDYTMSHMRMFSGKTRVTVVNGDDESSAVFANLRRRVLTFGQKDFNTFRIKNMTATETGMAFDMEYYGHKAQYAVPYIGDYNAYNTVAALATLYGLEKLIDGMGEAVSRLVPAPGRMEKISSDKGFDVIVDYAHSPDSFENLFKAVKPLAKGKIIAVTGACGDRDWRVRPQMGRLLAEYCDRVVITTDDPYTENPEKIASELIRGLVESKAMVEGQTWFNIPDRKTAIQKGIALAQKDDMVLVLGKGAEQWQVFADKKIPWDDRKVVKELVGS